MSSENVELAKRIVASLPLDDLGEALDDEDGLAALGATLEPLVVPEIEVVRVGPEYTGEAITYSGLTGFVEFWTDWLEPWESFRIETEKFVDAGDKVVQLVDISAPTKTGEVRVEQRGAAVMTFRDSKMTRIEFHLDRERAMKAAGLSE